MLAGLGRRPRLLVLIALAVSPFLHDRGKLTFDTKLDLSLNPAAFLQRALHLWDPQGGLGQLQDQAFGYLFPTGPFFLAGRAAGVPPWVTERAWEALILVLACEGARRLSREMTRASASMALLAGVAYALSPRMLTVVGPISSEALPMALLPWALLPLVVDSELRPRRAALRSSCVVLLMGGINAAVTAVVMLPLLVWTLTRRRGRRQLLVWQGVGSGLAVLWWLAPLLVLGRYSPPFLDWIESARNTTAPVTFLNALRGADHWVAYVGIGGDPVWPAGHELASRPFLLLASAAVAGCGLLGLARRDLPEGRFLRASALLGLLALTVGHTGLVSSPVAPSAQALLDGALSPLRNIHKFDPLLRLPLVLGAAHLGTLLQGREGRGWSARRLPAGVYAACVAVAAFPLASSGFHPGPAFRALPSWWEAASSYVDAHGRGRTLVLPGAGFEDYTWGRTVDDPLQVLAAAPWAVRSQLPYGGAGSTRLLDRIESVLETGRGSPALADLLARSGVGQVLVRNDLDTRHADTVAPAAVHAALEGSPGLQRTATFGPSRTPADVAVRVGPRVSYPALELYDVQRPVSLLTTYAADRAVRVVGGPEALLPLIESGLVTAVDPVLLAGDATVKTARTVLTDTLRKRARSFGQVHDAEGPTLSAAEPYADNRSSHDLLPPTAGNRRTRAEYDTAVAVTASTSAASGTAAGGARPGSLPYAAIDGRDLTAWRSDASSGPVGQWWQVTFRTAQQVRPFDVQFLHDRLLGSRVTTVTVRTDTGALVQQLERGHLSAPPGLTRTLRIVVTGVAGRPRGDVGISEVRIPDLAVDRALRLAGPSGAGDVSDVPDVLLGLDPEPVPQCTTAGGTVACGPPGSAREGDPDSLDRVFELPAAADVTVTGTVLPTPGQQVLQLLEPLAPTLVATASSTLGDSGALSPSAAVDGDPQTSWVAAGGDPSPQLRLRWRTPQLLTAITVSSGPSAGVVTPRRLLLNAAGEQRDVQLDDLGNGRFAPLRADEVDVVFPPSSTARPVAVAEVRFPGAAHASPVLPGEAATGALCGFGPTLLVDRTVVQTAVAGTIADVRASRPLRLVPCGAAGRPLRLAPGSHQVRVIDSGIFSARTLALVAARREAADSPTRSTSLSRWGATSRTFTLGDGPEAIVAVPENANPGWVASLGGRPLKAVTVDGWQQAWVVPAGRSGQVRLTFLPDRTYRSALLLGALAALVLVLLTAVLGRAFGRRGAPAVAEDAVPPRRAPVWLQLGGTVVLACLLAGTWGFVVVVLTAVCIRQLAGARWLPLVALVGAAALAAVGRAQGIADPDALTAEQVLALAAALAVALGPLLAPPDREPAGDPGSA